MASQWYTSKITGNPIYSVGIVASNGNQIRHFTDQDPILGSTTKCGLTITDGVDIDIVDTCITCSLVVCVEKVVPIPSPEPDESIEIN